MSGRTLVPGGGLRANAPRVEKEEKEKEKENEKEEEEEKEKEEEKKKEDEKEQEEEEGRKEVRKEGRKELGSHFGSSHLGSRQTASGLRGPQPAPRLGRFSSTSTQPASE